jgi:hypothetical protein
MKTILRKIFLGILATFIFCVGLLVLFVFNPSFLYAKETSHKNFTIYHNNSLSDNLTALLEESLSRLKNHEIYNEDIKISVCLNDGSVYPAFIQKLMGPDVIRSFANISVVHASEIDVKNNKMIFREWNNESFSASQFFTHSFTHCLQYKKYGFWGSNPIARHDEWKWEGYTEYTSFGRNYDLNSLLKKYFEPASSNWIQMEDGSKTIKHHFKYLAMMKYCIEIRQMSYDQILESKKSHDEVYAELISWYNNQDSPILK